MAKHKKISQHTKSPHERVVVLAVFFIVIIAAAIADRGQSMSPVWTAPYFSAAANLDFRGKFIIDLDEVNLFKELDSEQRRNYKFAKTEVKRDYNHNPVAFAYIIVVAKQLFPFLGDMKALVWLQILIHSLITASIFYALGNRLAKWLFVLVYGLNPLVLYFVAFPYYYFWQVMPAFGVVVLLLVSRESHQLETLRAPTAFLILVFSLILGLVMVTRPTIIGITVVFFALFYSSRIQPIHIKVAATLLFILSCVITYQPTGKNIWHTAYIGIGAYPNSHLKALSDDTGYALYYDVTGEKLNASPGGNFYNQETMEKYKNITRRRVLELLRDEPDMFLRNAILNTLLGFSPGYLVRGSPSVNILMAIIGFIFITALLLKKQFILTVSVLAGTATYSLYFPPIPAYMFGNYILLGYSTVILVADWWSNRK